MSWNTVIGQDAAKSFLRASLRAGRTAHAYLFSGPAGVGKRTTAFALAQALLCHEPPAPDEACGACRSCRWLAAREGLACGHPDLIVPIRYLASSERVLGDQEQLIPRETMQELSKQLHLAPRSGSRRVALIPEAHRMCLGQAEAANSFLKTLEEPPPHAVAILTSSRPEALLETIVSRCQLLAFRRLSLEQIGEGLRQARSGTERDLAAALADGSLGRARELLEGDLGRWRAAVMKGLELSAPAGALNFGLGLWSIADAEGARLFQGAKDAAREETPPEDEDEGEDPSAREAEEAQKTASGWKRFVFTRLLDLCEVAFRDALVRAAGAGEEALLQRDQARLAEKLAGQYGVEGCERILAALREARLATRLYVNGALVGRMLAGRMAEAP
ncbi:MAG: AAA family ATPase [Planctomycetota bacterium]|nr:AAA family ATPase [Planctomycetota bacterium]